MNLESKQKDIQEIVNALYNCYLGELCDDQDYLEENIIEPFKEKYQKPFDWAFGATKIVLIFEDLNFVVKIPLEICNGYHLCGAGDTEDGWDYCGQESLRFEWMLDENVEKAFAETKYLTDIHGYPIYIQEYVQPLSNIRKAKKTNDYYNHTEIDTEKVEQISDKHNYYKIDLEWEADVLVMYGEEFYNHLMTVIADYGIEDLRTPNIGYIGKRPVIIDYAGFDEDC